MLAIVLVLVLGLVVGLLRGGRWQGQLPYRWPWLVPAALAAQWLGLHLAQAGLARWLVVGSYGALTVFLVANARFQSMRMILLGIALNLIPIAANGGRMPVDLELARLTGMDVSSLVNGSDPKHVAIGPGTRFAFLSDVIYLPEPIQKVISVGDVAVLLGIFLLTQELMGKPLAIGLESGS